MIHQKKFKSGVTKRPRSLNRGKAIAMAIFDFLMHDLARVTLRAQ